MAHFWGELYIIDKQSEAQAIAIAAAVFGCIPPTTTTHHHHQCGNVLYLSPLLNLWNLEESLVTAETPAGL